ncbi:transposase [Streptomyces cellulosae]|uniref:transposase n=1 Tax=Streptomyces cellulosae TaxID=1968 RepID=UPI002250BE7A|nr:transposase [Streptomyces cellulosae]MCX4480318.1 transposase [Streptomyces cellulosae]WTB79797.1 transposase [Streptomyces cellulosae]WTB85959.1 transposase [Streptomyces cellulosae]WTB86421.1 transposase [Streptomyces cellulosae]
MASRKRIYDAEFREGAVRIVTETGKPIPEVAEDLGIHPGTLHSWVSRARRNGAPSSDRPAVAEPSPGSRLRESSPTRELPVWLARTGHRESETATAQAPARRDLDATSAKAEKLLGWRARPIEDTIAETAERLLARGIGT